MNGRKKTIEYIRHNNYILFIFNTHNNSKTIRFYISILDIYLFIIYLYYIQKYEKVIVYITSLDNHTICIRLNSVIFLPIIKK